MPRDAAFQSIDALGVIRSRPLERANGTPQPVFLSTIHAQPRI
jgi:hypothetical protein